MKQISLCFCIPTYNRSESVCRLVKSILISKNNLINVVVLDNGSTDDTLHQLSNINDSRLNVLTNGENKGALFNMVNVLNKGVGDFLVYSTDQDYIDVDYIDEFMGFLSEGNNISCGYCRFDASIPSDYKIYSLGFESVLNIAYKGYHPTGYFFNNDMLKTIDIVSRFSDYENVDLFPLEFVFAELCTMGRGAIFYKKIFTPETGENVVKHKSSTTNGTAKNAFFSPSSRLKMAVNYTKHVGSLNLGIKEKELIVRNVFYNSFVQATREYKTIMRNEKLCSHYYMEPVRINNFEVLKSGSFFYREFLHQTRSCFVSNGWSLIKFNLLTSSRIIIGILQRRFKFTKKVFDPITRVLSRD